MRQFLVIAASIALLNVVSVGSAFAEPLRANFAMPAAVTPTLAAHAVVGEWETVAGGESGTATFAADGSVIFDVPLAHLADPAVELVSPAAGTWEAVGVNSALFTVVQRFEHANGVVLGVATLTGYVTLSPDGTAIIADGDLTRITWRDANGRFLTLLSGNDASPVLSATRITTERATVSPREAQAVAKVRRGIPGCATCI